MGFVVGTAPSQIVDGFFIKSRYNCKCDDDSGKFFLFVAWLTTAASKPIIIMSCYNWAFFMEGFFPM